MPGGAYAIERKIASGGAGTVYLARRSGPGGFSRRVAIKRLHAHLNDDDKLRKILLKEARLASLLHHANVVAVVDVDEIEGTLGLVMEWVDGASLAELLAGSRTTEGEAAPTSIVVRILLDACAGLAAVHELRDERGRPTGLLHCDVSPQNLLVGVDGITRVADFGLAKITEASMATSTAGLVAGKLGYVAPEILEGRPFSTLSDLFALGVVAWEALARRRVLDVMEGSTRGVALAPPPPLSRVAPEVGDAFDAVITRATLRDPTSRFPSVRIFGDALEAAAGRAGLLASAGDVARWVRGRRAPRGDLARLRIASDGIASVDHSFAETAALGDEGTPPLPELETTDPITEETMPAAIGGRDWATLPDEDLQGVRRPPMLQQREPTAAVEASRPGEIDEVPVVGTGTEASSAAEPEGARRAEPAPSRRRSWSKAVLVGMPVLLVAAVGVWASRGAATPPGPSPDPTVRSAAGHEAPAPEASAPTAPQAPAPEASGETGAAERPPGAADTPAASGVDPVDRRLPAPRRPPRAAPAAPAQPPPTPTPPSAVPPPPANPYRR